MRIPSYNKLLKRIPAPDETNTPVFNTKGRLIITLVEYRVMDEIEWVINAMCRVYNTPGEIGFAIVHGTVNADWLETKYGKWENIKLINTGHDNLNRGTYSALLKTPQLWENFTEWSHVLIYQTDACIMRKIDDIYFEYDYIGSPWEKSNQWTTFNAGNGGFSLRSVNAMITSCEGNRNTPFDKIHRGNEDGFFSSQSTFKYPPVNSPLHKAFAVEKMKYPTPVGCHQVYYGWSASNAEWTAFLQYMEDALINDKPSGQNIKTLAEAAEFFGREMVDEIYPVNKPPPVPVPVPVSVPTVPIQLLGSGDNGDNGDKNGRWTSIGEVEKYKYRVGPFTTFLNQAAKNNWNTSCDHDYDILFCKTDDPATVVETYHIEKRHEACVHKKFPGVKYFDDTHYVYLAFYPGFEGGGRSGCDIHAPWGHHFNRCEKLPKNGGVILRCAKDPNVRERLKEDENLREIERLKAAQKMREPEAQNRIIEQYKLTHLASNVNVLVYDLFCGVGYYNQLFSLELGIYLANRSGRHLVLNARHPLVACGRPDRRYGPLMDYVGKDFEKFLPHGYSLRTYGDSMSTFANEINFSDKMSNVIIVDEELNTPANNMDISEFAHFRQRVSDNRLAPMFDETSRVVSFTGSNASRIFTNFYTTPDKYGLMSRIAESVNTYCPEINGVVDMVREKMGGGCGQPIGDKFIAIHLRFGDWHKKVDKIIATNDKIVENVSAWLDKHNVDNLPLYVMTDRKDNPFFDDLRKRYAVLFMDELLEPEHKTALGARFKNTNVAEFLVQKIICEDAKWFIGSQGSTVSTHIQYNNFLRGKDYEMHGYIRTTNYDGATLKFRTDDAKHYTWAKKNYIGGHPLSWSMFFGDNVVLAAADPIEEENVENVDCVVS